MKLRSAKASLSIGRIADEWAKEIAGQAGALSRDEILRELTKVYWSGAFDKSADASRPAPILRFNHNAPIEMFGEGRAHESHTHKKDSPAGVPDPTSTGLHEATRTLVSVLMRSIENGAAADIADEKRRLLEKIEIPRISFREWLVRAGHDLPRFWFDSTEIAAREAPTSIKGMRPTAPAEQKKGGRKPGPYRQRMWRILDQARQQRPDYLDQPFSRIDADLKRAFKRDYPDGSCRLPGRSALQDALKAYKRERGL